MCSSHLARAIQKENEGSRGLGKLKTDLKLSKALGFTGISENLFLFFSSGKFKASLHADDN